MTALVTTELTGTLEWQTGQPAADAEFVLELAGKVRGADTTGLPLKQQITLDSQGMIPPGIKVLPSEGFDPSPVNYRITELWDDGRVYEVTIPSGLDSVDLFSLAPILTPSDPVVSYATAAALAGEVSRATGVEALKADSADLGSAAASDVGDFDPAGSAAAAQVTSLSAVAAETTRAESVEAVKADLVSGKVPTSQLPAISSFDTWPVASQAEMLALSTANVGDVAVRSDQGGKRYWLTAAPPSTLGNWLPVTTDPSAAVDSVNGFVGSVHLGYADVGADPTGAATTAQAAAIAAAAIDATTKASAAGATAAGLINDETTRAMAVEALKADLVAGKVPTAQLPAISSFNTWPVASQAAMLALTDADAGDVAIRSDQGGKRYWLTAAPPSTLGNWLAVTTDPAANVDSVNGFVGSVHLGYADVGADPAGAATTAQTNAEANTAAAIAALGTAADSDVADFDPAGSAATAQGAAQTYAAGLVSTEFTRATGVEALKADLVGGKVPTSQLPAVPTFVTWPVASQAAMLALAAAVGDVAVRTDQTNARYMLTVLPASTLGHWLLLTSDPTAAVDSVNGHVGPVVLGYADVGADPTGAATAAQAAAITAAAADATAKATAAQTAAATLLASTVAALGLQSASQLPASAFDASLTATALKSANYTAAPGDRVRVDLTASWTLQLPTTPPHGSRVGAYLEVYGALQALTIACGGTDHIDNKGTLTTTIVRSEGVGQYVILAYDAPAGVWRIDVDLIPKAIYDALYAPSLLVPSDAVAGRNLFVAGNSFAAEPRVWVPMRFVDRVAARLKGSFFGGGATGGALAHDIAKWFFGSITLISPNGVSQTETWNVSTSTLGVGILELLRNDAGYDALESTAKARAGFTNSVMALIRLMQAGTYYQDNDASFAYTGTWNSLTSSPTLRKGGRYHSTSTNGSFAVWTTPVCTDFDVILDGYDSAAGFNGADITYQIDGGAVVNATTQDVFAGQIYKHAAGETSSNLLTPIVIGGHGLASAVHTIKIVHNGVGGRFLDVVGGLVRSPNPLQILIGKANKMSSAAGVGYNTPAYAGGGASWATDQIYNGLIDAIVAQFTDGSVVSYDPMAYGWDINTCLMADGIHPNDLGTKVYATAVMSVLNALPPRAGLTYLFSP